MSKNAIGLLRLTLAPGLGPILIRRAIDTFGGVDNVLGARAQTLMNVDGIGPKKAELIARGLGKAEQLARDELDLAERLGVRVIGWDEAEYPPLLRQIADPPPVLYVRGRLGLGETSPDASSRAARDQQYTVAIVGSRTCSHYGMEQAERFAAALAQAGLTIVSGGARGIDSAAHHAALRVRGETIAVVGSGLAECYPPENRELFREIAEGGNGGGGAVVSELPLRTPPAAENFPARNRIISGISLGVLVIEAGRKSGALITARLAAEEHGREVFVLPGRVDSPASEGSLDLLKDGGGLLVTCADDVLRGLEASARHQFDGTHEARYATPAVQPSLYADEPAHAVSRSSPSPASTVNGVGIRDAGLSDSQRALVAALDEPRSVDDLARLLNTSPAALRVDLTMLEVKGRVRRQGTLVGLAR